MTDSLPILREALTRAETHRDGLQAINDQLRALHTGDVGAFVTMDAVDAVDALISSIRFAIDRVEESQRQDAALDAEMRELGIDPAEFDDEEPDWTDVAADMLSTPGSLTSLLYPKPGGCYLSSSGVAVHVRPSCRCPR